MAQETKQIIRIEHPVDGIGLFQSNQITLSWTHLSSILYRHQKFNNPSMNGLDIEEDYLEWFCAYKSVEQVQEWILKDEMTSLCNDYGFIVYLLEVNQYQEGRDQIIFTKESIISKKDITELFIN